MPERLHPQQQNLRLNVIPSSFPEKGRLFSAVEEKKTGPQRGDYVQGTSAKDLKGANDTREIVKGVITGKGKGVIDLINPHKDGTYKPEKIFDNDQVHSATPADKDEKERIEKVQKQILGDPAKKKNTEITYY